MISDASIPFARSLASAFGARGWSVTLLSEIESPSIKTGETGAEMPSVTALSWNRPSALSARTVCIALRAAHRELSDAVIVFDSRAISQVPDFSLGTELGAVADRYIRGVMLLAFETAGLFFKQGRGRITFAVRESPAEGGTSSTGAESGQAGDTGVYSLSGQSAAAVARAAFVALAEEIAASFSASGNPELKSFLVKLDPTDDVMNLDWLASRLTGESALRSQSSWVKAGSRGIFGII